MSANGHANDSDAIVGDNGDIVKLVGGATGYLSFAYDNFGTKKIVPRAIRLLDYTAGGPDFDPAHAATDIGSIDLIHGENGDDFIYGMVGADAIYGDGQNDTIVGGWGSDWISGGGGDDGILGDDGRILLSRVGTAEPLAGVPVVAGQNTSITTPGRPAGRAHERHQHAALDGEPRAGQPRPLDVAHREPEHALRAALRERHHLRRSRQRLDPRRRRRRRDLRRRGLTESYTNSYAATRRSPARS